MTKLTCSTHGTQNQTFVCRHIIEGLTQGEPRGFYWGKEDGVFEAICDDCNELSEAAFNAQGVDIIESLCFGCFCDAAQMNGIDAETDLKADQHA